MPEMFEERYVYLFHLQTQKADYPLRHYSYECKAVVQERPYVSRPSRTQQLMNPKLMPKLTSDFPQDLLRKYVFSLLCLKVSSGLLELQRVPMRRGQFLLFIPIR